MELDYRLIVKYIDKVISERSIDEKKGFFFAQASLVSVDK